VKRTRSSSSMLRCMVRFVRLKDVFRNDVDRKRGDGDPKTREDVAEHRTIRENGVLTPRLAFCPWIPIHWGWVGHLQKKAAQ